MGMQKGITDEDASGRANSKKKKKRQDEKRVRGMVEFQMEQERKKYVQKIKETEDNVQYLMQQLGEEQLKSLELNEKLQMYGPKGEVCDLPYFRNFNWEILIFLFSFRVT